MKIVSTLAFAVLLVGEAAEVYGADNTERFMGEKIIVCDDGTVEGLPGMQEDTVYLVNAKVFDTCKEERKDLCMFDIAYTNRDEEGKVVSQGGFIFA